MMATIVVLGGFLFSSLQDSFAVDGHHWGLMLSNVQDLCRSRAPYQEIFIQYGILTTLVHALAHCGLGLSITVEAAAYALALGLLYALTVRVTGRPSLDLQALALCASLHPAIAYSVSNYVAYPFFIGSLLFLTAPERSVEITRHHAFSKAALGIFLT